MDKFIYRHFRALEDIVDMRFPYFGKHIPEEEISDEERKEIHDILEEMESGKEYRLEDVRAELDV